MTRLAQLLKDSLLFLLGEVVKSDSGPYSSKAQELLELIEGDDSYVVEAAKFLARRLAHVGDNPAAAKALELLESDGPLTGDLYSDWLVLQFFLTEVVKNGDNLSSDRASSLVDSIMSVAEGVKSLLVEEDDEAPTTDAASADYDEVASGPIFQDSQEIEISDDKEG